MDGGRHEKCVTSLGTTIGAVRFPTIFFFASVRSVAIYIVGMPPHDRCCETVRHAESWWDSFQKQRRLQCGIAVTHSMYTLYLLHWLRACACVCVYLALWRRGQAVEAKPSKKRKNYFETLVFTSCCSYIVISHADFFLLLFFHISHHISFFLYLLLVVYAFRDRMLCAVPFPHVFFFSHFSPS